MEDTKIEGRLDIVVFPNGGYEFLARVPADPEVPEDLWLPEVNKHVAANQNLPEPKKFTGIYRIRGDQLVINWGDWQGEIPNYAPSIEEMRAEVERNMAQAAAMMANDMPPPMEDAGEIIDVEPGPVEEV